LACAAVTGDRYCTICRGQYQKNHSVAAVLVRASDKRITCDEEFSDSEDEGAGGRRNTESHRSSSGAAPAKRPRVDGGAGDDGSKSAAGSGGEEARSGAQALSALSRGGAVASSQQAPSPAQKADKVTSVIPPPGKLSHHSNSSATIAALRWRVVTLLPLLYQEMTVLSGTGVGGSVSGTSTSGPEAKADAAGDSADR